MFLSSSGLCPGSASGAVKSRSSPWLMSRAPRGCAILGGFGRAARAPGRGFGHGYALARSGRLHPVRGGGARRAGADPRAFKETPACPAQLHLSARTQYFDPVPPEDRSRAREAFVAPLRELRETG